MGYYVHTVKHILRGHHWDKDFSGLLKEVPFI